MSGTKKRKRSGLDASPVKKLKDSDSSTPVRRDLLESSYTRVSSLRAYVLSQLPKTSRIRRKKITGLGSQHNASEATSQLAKFLDTTLVCTNSLVDELDDSISEQWQFFSQKADDSNVTISGGVAASVHIQSEIVDFVIWRLFSQSKPGNSWPKHLLCDGFRRGPGDNGSQAANLPGIHSVHPNSQVKALRDHPWPSLLALMGQSGAKIMVHLLLNCCLFLALNTGENNYYQICGSPLSDLAPSRAQVTGASKTLSKQRKPSNISLMRSRIFYAKPALTAGGLIQPGFKHIPQPLHDYTLREEEIASIANSRHTKVPKRLRGATQTLVERLQILHGRCSYLELLEHYCPCPSYSNDQVRRQGPAVRGPENSGPSQKGQRCNPSVSNISTAQQPPVASDCNSIVELACPISNVSAFCQAVLAQIIPNGFWGIGEVAAQNKAVLLKKINHFTKLRRFETMTLAEVTEGFKIAAIPWLQIPGQQGQKSSLTNTRKQHEIFNELLFYIFDSLLIPLIRTNFYVTESNTHRQQIFFFRHSVWRSITEPALLSLKNSMLEELETCVALEKLGRRKLGYGQIRLLPKGNKLRTIMNLRRRTLDHNKSKSLGLSINSIMRPVHSMLKLEKATNPSRLGSAMFSVGDIYRKLKEFKMAVEPTQKRLYFAKLDVNAAFDTIPQAEVVKLMSQVPSKATYTIAKHAEVMPRERILSAQSTSAKAIQPIRRWHANALDNPSTAFLQRLETQLAVGKKNTIFIENVAHHTHAKESLLQCLAEHIQENLVKVGKKFYRQRKGIPQGSVVSSFLCNYFYAQLEAEHLSFLDAPDTLLLRLTDDFLLITLDRSKASRFVEVMHGGIKEYGVEINLSKTLTNFNMTVDGTEVPRVAKGAGFPYCGTLIDCETLEITKDYRRSKGVGISMSLTVEFGRSPGQNFQRKTLSEWFSTKIHLDVLDTYNGIRTDAFKIHSHSMFFDTTHNSVRKVRESLRGVFSETARKMWAYIRCLPPHKQPNSNLVISKCPDNYFVYRPDLLLIVSISAETIAKVAEVAVLLLTAKSRKLRFQSYAFDIRRAQVIGLAYTAFIDVLELKQSQYRPVLAWLKAETVRLDVERLLGRRAQDLM
ncbi:hypothetical protein S7711_00935 [Stachybotrys chartarum IBT 7711]|uniref:Telomerase reverse transcriptase n=1 Tax=Stachybotrys chartarum (strain CBS 109288 / IBT 7711) TaxID=1280523 RepID=A0A084B0N4_STACB|nr:hypothetical protein S7711_00935 [Stachybotrys chartarum IBT 7711]